MSNSEKKASSSVKKILRAFRIPPLLDEKFVHYAQDLEKNFTDAFIFLLESALGEHENPFKWLDDACPALVHLEEGFFCAIKAPAIRKLGNAERSDASKVCGACKSLHGIKEKAALATQLMKSDYTVLIPYCKKGGVFDESLKNVICPENGRRKRVDYCTDKIGRKCPSFKYIQADARLATSDKR